MTDSVKELEELVRKKKDSAKNKEDSSENKEKDSTVLKTVEPVEPVEEEDSTKEDSTTLKAVEEGKGNEAWQKQMLEVQNLTLGVLNKIIKKITPTETNQKPQEIPAPPEKEQEAEKEEEESSKVSRSILRQIW